MMLVFSDAPWPPPPPERDRLPIGVAIACVAVGSIVAWALIAIGVRWLCSLM